jgi:hypothetical protein
MNELWLNTLELLGLAWWVEIITDSPNCTYYFGPYVSASEANASKPGFIEDLEQEGTKGIKVTVKRCKPTQLTVFDEKTDTPAARNISPAFSGQT